MSSEEYEKMSRIIEMLSDDEAKSATYAEIERSDAAFLSWLYWRLVARHGEGRHADYMWRFRKIIERLAEEEGMDTPAEPAWRKRGLTLSSEGFGNIARRVGETLAGVELTPSQGQILIDGIRSRVRLPEEGMDTPESTPNQPLQGPPAPPRPKGLTEGRNIHWVNPRDNRHYAGIVAEVVDRERGIANLAVFAFPSRSVWWEEGCVYDPTGVARGSWHYLEPVE